MHLFICWIFAGVLNPIGCLWRSARSFVPRLSGYLKPAFPRQGRPNSLTTIDLRRPPHTLQAAPPSFHQHPIQFHGLEIHGKMSEGGIFGHLQFAESTHGWALDGGIEAANMYFHEKTYGRDGAATIGEAWARLQRHIQGQPQIASLVFQLGQRRNNPTAVDDVMVPIENEMHRLHLAPQYAFWRIGFAGQMISLMTSHGDDDLVTEVEQRIHEVNTLYHFMAIKPQVMLAEFCKSIKDPRSNNFSHVNVREIIQRLSRPMTVLCVSAAPDDQSIFDVLSMNGSVGQALSNSRYRYIPAFVLNCQPQVLGQYIQQYRPAIIHFSGHGDTNLLCFDDGNRQTSLIDNDQLIEILGNATLRGLRAVVLNACHSQQMANAIANSAGFAISSTCTLYVPEAVAFSRLFYLGLAAGWAVDDAFERAKGALPPLSAGKFVLNEGD